MITSIKFIGFSFWVSLLLAGVAQSEPAFNHDNQAKQNILIFGDSISAGYGLKPDETWSYLLQDRLNQQKFNYNIINASLTGETTGGGKLRLKKALRQHKPAIVVIELGGNDGLRGLNLKDMRSNLEFMIDLSLKSNHQILLAGMRLPPNYGLSFTQRFANVYQELAIEKQVPLVPFIFKGFANDPDFFQADQIHPNKKAQIHLLNNVWPTLKKMFRRN